MKNAEEICKVLDQVIEDISNDKINHTKAKSIIKACDSQVKIARDSIEYQKEFGKKKGIKFYEY